ncbi:VOC family protein [Egicoccus sp. AB-alg6-2]|uniref:VOC family protein n=1 Tax=Egicoccus sp. AB-alg6-2 TaxID=3242692 RepID=UPI00359E3FAE
MTTPIGFQVTFDANDPHAQARFWAAALHYELEADDTMIRRLLDDGVVTEEDVVEIDGTLFWRTGSAIRHPADADVGPFEDPAPRRLLFLAVPEGKTVKNRVHLDLNVGTDNIDAEVARLTELGARELYRVDEPSSTHTTMADPEGNEFCVQ